MAVVTVRQAFQPDMKMNKSAWKGWRTLWDMPPWLSKKLLTSINDINSTRSTLETP